ncbi:MAG: hypothetical protein QNJ91_15460 [Gammaproteobacteria bacterium]|nr:hypothetical protein [Gammaproteobacteria bacterium]
MARCPDIEARNRSVHGVSAIAASALAAVVGIDATHDDATGAAP